MRLEQDAMGTLELPDEAYWGIVPERHRIAFDVGPMTLDDYESYVAAVALIKVACARANAEIGALDTTKASAIEKAAFVDCRGKVFRPLWNQYLSRLRNTTECGCKRGDCSPG